MQLYILCKVDDVRATRRFYEALFSPSAVSADDEGMRLTVGSVEIDFYPRNPNKPRVEQSTYPGFILSVTSVEQIESFHERLQALGASVFYEATEPLLSFNDPDGYAWQVYQAND